MSKYFYAFKGQNATTGTPNIKTGLMSYYGDIITFSSRAKRDRFFDEYYSNNPSEYVAKCNKSTARQYCLGMSVYDFNEYMRYVESLADEHYESYFND